MSGIPMRCEGDTADERMLSAPRLGLRRVVFFGLVLATAAVATAVMAVILAAHGLGPLQWAALALSALLFAWIANAFWNAVVGCALLALGRHPLTLRRPRPVAPTAVRGRTALVMPVHNEEPERALRGLEATCRSLAATGEGARFEAFVLSDTTEPVIALAEERAFAALEARLANTVELHYRRRPLNTGRKPGNIADFCARHGERFDYMVVLDADSIMAGETIVELARTLDANPNAGLLQTVPVPVRQHTLFGRLFQLAAALYSPMLGAGISFWSGNAANYWGHNAILRIEPFARHCQLPLLPGRPPLGGEILSHDFVEAALLRRAGWDAWLLPGLGGSYEELPANLLDYGRRDRRWTQGNLQHLRLLREPGLHAISRLHFLQGAMCYGAAVFWLLLLAATLAGGLPLPGTAATATAGADVGAGLAWALLASTIALLLAPRVLGLGLALWRRPHAFGGRRELVASGLLETAFSLLIAPLLMVFHAGFVAAVLAGSNVRWEAQPREGRRITWREAGQRSVVPVVLGVVVTAVLGAAAPHLLPWFAPVLPGLLAAPAIIRFTSSTGPGEALRRRGWLRVPAEVAPDPVLVCLERLSGQQAHPLHHAVTADQPVVEGAGHVQQDQAEDGPGENGVPEEQRAGEGIVLADQRR